MRVGRAVLVAVPLLWLATLQAQFIQQGNKLVGSDAVSGSRQGSGVAISGDGNTAITGGFVDGNGVEASWIFTRANGIWSQQGPKLVGTGAARFSNMRSLPVNVAISGDGNSVMVSSHDDNSAWVFVRNNGVWSQQGPKLVGSAPGYPAVTAVALSGDGSTALVGNPFAVANGDVLGSTWVFTRSNGVWTRQTRLVGSGYIQGDQCPVNQGYRVALSVDGETALVGAIGDDDCTGATWVFGFDEDSGAWYQQTKLVGTNGVEGRQQGYWVAISGDGNTALTSGAVGPAWVFIRNNGGWTQQAKLDGSGAVALSADGNTAVTGGSIFTRRNGSWTRQTNLGSGSVAISADASTVMIGMPDDNGGVGSASVFVQPAATHLSVSAPASATAGVPFNFTVTALDSNNNPVPGFLGTLLFFSAPPGSALPPESPLTNGTGVFSATIFSGGNFTITVNDDPLGLSAHSGPIAVTGGPAGTAPGGVSPASGSGLSQTMTFEFQSAVGLLDVVNVLINDGLDGRNACYLAYNSHADLYLVADNGATLLGPLSRTAGATLTNSQCTVTMPAGSGFCNVGCTTTLTLNLTFNAAFAGNKTVYLAARDSHGGNSGWQALGVWQVPFSLPGSIAVQNLSPARSSAPSGTFQTFTETLTDSKGTADFSVVDLLVNDFLDGRQACYLAYVSATNTLFLVDDTGDAGGPFIGAMVLNGGPASMQNGHCSVNGARSAISRNGNTLAIALSIAFKSAFAGHRVLWVAGRDGAGGNNTGWQALGTVTVQQ